ncbi:MAG: hypothetical protein HYV32_01565 [Candidatus Kerfeldbacteria bacterium]|nr:hypothetical protein [Candidatus Kerfeldbacteria bacterium]
MKRGDYLDILLRSPKTIFTTKDIALLWREKSMNAARVRLHSYIKSGKLIHVRKGVYAKDYEYSRYELATNILRPAYISFETVLGAAGITFQYYGQIFVASYVNRDIICDGQEYAFRTIKFDTLINPAGIDQSEQYPIAITERAFLDTIYRSKDYYFDNLSPLDWEKVFALLPLYENKKMVKTVQKYYDYYQATK